MKNFSLQVAIIVGAGLATGFAFSLTSNIQLHVPIKDNTGKPPPVRVPDPNGPTGSTGATGTRPSVKNTPPPSKTPDTEGADLISLEAAKALFDAHNSVFIDARPKTEFLESHIVGAMQLEKSDVDGQPPAKVLNYLPGMEIVVYCHGELCTDSANVVKRLLALNKGIGPMHIINEGFPGWQKANYPVEKGPEAGFQ